MNILLEYKGAFEMLRTSALTSWTVFRLKRDIANYEPFPFPYKLRVSFMLQTLDMADRRCLER